MYGRWASLTQQTVTCTAHFVARPYYLLLRLDSLVGADVDVSLPLAGYMINLLQSWVVS